MSGKNTLYSVEKYLGINWIKNKTRNSKAEKMACDSCPDGNVVVECIRNVKCARMWADVTPEELITLANNNICLMEVIYKFPHKVFFDIDKLTIDNKDGNNYLTKIMNKLNEVFPNSDPLGDWAISGSETDIKMSYHIINNSYNVTNEKDRALLSNICKTLKGFDNGFDEKVYAKVHDMKCIKQSKPGDRRVQNIIQNKNEGAHFITCFINPNAVSLSTIQFNEEIFEAVKMESLTQHTKLNLSTLPMFQKEIPEKYMSKEQLSPMDLLRLAPLDKQFDHVYTFFIARFCFHNHISLDNYLSWYKRKHTEESKLEGKKRMWEQVLPDSIPVSEKQLMKVLENYYPQLANRPAGALNRMFDLTQYQSNIEIIDRIEPKHFEIQEKFVVFDIGMCGGKTAQTINYIKSHPEKKFIFITPNQSLGFSAFQRFKDAQINVEHYDIDYTIKPAKNSQQKPKSAMNKAGNIIICLNSLHYLKSNKYDIVVLDESETTLSKWFNNETLNNIGSRAINSWNTFKRIVKEASRVICLDAFTSQLTINFVQGITDMREETFDDEEIGVEDLSLKIYKRDKEVSERVCNVIPYYAQWQEQIIQDLKNNKKLYIFYPFKDGNKNYCSMTDFKLTLEKQTGKKGIMYHSGCDDESNKTLRIVNETWYHYDFVLANSKITVGVNYDLKEDKAFDKVYISIASFTLPREVIQSSCRCREIKDNIINVIFLSDENNKDTYTPNARLIADDKIYNTVSHNVLTEVMAPIKSSFYKFCKLAGYKVIIEQKHIDKALIKRMHELFECNVDSTFESIKDINEEEAEQITEKMATHSATASDKIKLQKFYFIRKFKEETPQEMLIDAWDSRRQRFVESIISLYYDYSILKTFKMIQEHNKWSEMIPDNDQIQKAVLNPELVARIFDPNGWIFTRLTKTSNPKSIVRNMFNAVFKSDMFRSVKGDSKSHVYKTHRNESLYELYTNCIRYLRCYNEKCDVNEVSELDKGIAFGDDDVIDPYDE